MSTRSVTFHAARTSISSRNSRKRHEEEFFKKCELAINDYLKIYSDHFVEFKLSNEERRTHIFQLQSDVKFSEESLGLLYYTNALSNKNVVNSCLPTTYASIENNKIKQCTVDMKEAEEQKVTEFNLAVIMIFSFCIYCKYYISF